MTSGTALTSASVAATAGRLAAWPTSRSGSATATCWPASVEAPFSMRALVALERQGIAVRVFEDGERLPRNPEAVYASWSGETDRPIRAWRIPPLRRTAKPCAYGTPIRSYGA